MNNGIEGMNDNDRLNGETQSLSDLKKEVTPLGITPSEIVSAIDNAGIRYDGDRILTRGGNITIGGVTYKKLTGAGEKGPVYQIGTDNEGNDYIRLRDREKSEMGIEYGKYVDNGGRYIYCGKLENGAVRKGKGYLIDFKTGNLYSGNFKGTNVFGDGVVKYGIMRGGNVRYNYDEYDGNLENGRKQGKGKYISANGGWTFDGTWEDEGMRNGKLEMANGDKYEGDFVRINEHDLWIRDIANKLDKGNFEDDEIVQLNERLHADNDGEIKGTAYYKEIDSKYEYTITSGKITELSNNTDFITMFGDKKKDNNLENDRGDIVLIRDINNNSYELRSWGYNTKRKLSGGYYDFGDGLKISIDNPYGIKLVKHMANLINYFKDYKTNRHHIDAFMAQGDDLCSGCRGQDIVISTGGMAPGKGGSTILKIQNHLLGEVTTHFGGFSAKFLADWLNKNI